jgi:hypothetical protein
MIDGRRSDNFRRMITLLPALEVAPGAGRRFTPFSADMDSPEDHTTPHGITRFRIAALSLDDYAGIAYIIGLAHDAGQSACDLFKD